MDTKKLRQITMAIILTATAIGFVGCGGSGSGNSKRAAGKAADSINAIDQALGQALSGGPAGLVLEDGTKSESISASVSCEPSGSVSVSGNVNEGETSGDFDLDFAFNGCEGINGTLDIFGNYTETSFEVTIDGSVEDSECKVVFSQLGMKLDLGGMSALTIEGDLDTSDGVDIDGNVDAGDVEVDADVDTSDGTTVSGNVDTDDDDGEDEDQDAEDDDDDDGEDEDQDAEDDDDDASIGGNVTITGSVSVTCGGETFSCGQAGSEITCDEMDDSSDDEDDEEDDEDEEDDSDDDEDDEEEDDEDEGDEE